MQIFEQVWLFTIHILFVFVLILEDIFIPFCRIFDVLEMVKSVDAAHENVLKALLMYIHSLCVGFGKYITQSRVNIRFCLDKNIENS